MSTTNERLSDKELALQIEMSVGNSGLSFSKALEFIKVGAKMQRAGWNGKGMWVCIQVPDEHSKMTLPYIYMKTADGKQVPWLASQTDILAEDWMTFRE